jgi:16S rRNA (guanine1207-N2)-methyltransferase
LPKNKQGSALVVNAQSGVLPLTLKWLNPEMHVTAFFDDAWLADRAIENFEQNPDHTIDVILAADVPSRKFSYVVLPLESRGIADLIRERIRLSASDWLATNGILISSSDTRTDKFVRGEIKKAFGSLHIAPEKRRHGAGTGYTARKPGSVLVNPPSTRLSYSVRDGQEELSFLSRIGLFSSHRLDGGSHALLSVFDGHSCRRILDLGCGNGVMGIIAAIRNPTAGVLFLDSSARAIECSRTNAAAIIPNNDAEFFLSASPLSTLTDISVDCVLTNPPYYGNLRIAEEFVQTAEMVLLPGGTLFLVTKNLEWYRSRLHRFSEIRTVSKGGYDVIVATR